MNFIHRSKRWRSTTTSTRTTTTAMSTTTTCSNCLLPLALAWGVGRGIFWSLLRKWCKFFHPDGPETLLAWTVSLYRHRGSKWHISYVRWHHVPVSVWCAWLDLVLKDNEEGAQACDAHAQVHGRTADPSSNRQTWYDRSQRCLPSNSRPSSN